MRKVLLIVEERAFAYVNVPALLVAGIGAADHVSGAAQAIGD